MRRDVDNSRSIDAEVSNRDQSIGIEAEGFRFREETCFFDGDCLQGLDFVKEFLEFYRGLRRRVVADWVWNALIISCAIDDSTIGRSRSDHVGSARVQAG